MSDPHADRLTPEEIVKAIEEILWGRHERGFVMGPLIGREEMILNEIKRLKLLDVRF